MNDTRISNTSTQTETTARGENSADPCLGNDYQCLCLLSAIAALSLLTGFEQLGGLCPSLQPNSSLSNRQFIQFLSLK